MRLICISLSFAALTGMANAGAQQDDVLACFAGMGGTTEWNTCLNTMFAPCADNDVGSDDHLSCLAQQRADWQETKRSVEGEVLDALTEDGIEELSGFMLAWPKFIEDKCNAVAEARAAISSDAARIGCQISEYALITNELSACLQGRSTEDYCRLRE